MKAKGYPRFDTEGVIRHSREKEQAYWKKEGMKIVVEWIEKNYPIGTPKWQTQLKDWGIK